MGDIHAGTRRGHHHRPGRRVARAIQVQAVFADISHFSRRGILGGYLRQGDLLDGERRQV